LRDRVEQYACITSGIIRESECVLRQEWDERYNATCLARHGEDVVFDDRVRRRITHCKADPAAEAVGKPSTRVVGTVDR